MKNRNIAWILFKIIILFAFIILIGCKKEEEKRIPELTTSEVNEITQTTASCGGIITSDGGSIITSRGICWNISTSPTIADNKTTNSTGIGNFTSSITALSPNTTYFVRAYATNAIGTAYGNEVSFTTNAETLPILTTIAVSSITTTTVTSGGNITSDGSAAVTARGVCWSTSITPTIANSKTTNGEGTGSFTSNIINLLANTTYYLRAYATNIVGTGYGEQLSFHTDPSTISDIDGNVYNVVRIGTQLWLKENLKTTKYRDGTTIPNVTDNTVWTSLTSGAYCWQSNDINNKNTYGALYNFHTIADNRKLCPIGWHVPTQTELSTLMNYVGSDGYKLKASSLWSNSNSNNNESGFTALPSGSRNLSGLFYGVGSSFYLWSSTESNTTEAFYLLLVEDGVIYQTSFNKIDGFSVRCLRD